MIGNHQPPIEISISRGAALKESGHSGVDVMMATTHSITIE